MTAEHDVMEQKLPTYDDLLWPTVRALRGRGGSATIQEISEDVARELALTDELLDMQHGSGPRSEVDYRAAWARTYLRWIGVVENPSRGVWTLTELGRRIQEQKVLDRVRQERARPHQGPRRDAKRDPEDPAALNDGDWKDVLLAILRGIPPDAFERLCQRVLRESGFVKVEVIGRTGDGGIDGVGVLRVNLLSFHVRFQCKRYAGTVDAREIRDFRGAMVGRAEKGLFLTSGGFTKDAQQEAVRDGAPAIDLIDGRELCELLKDHRLGVGVETVDVVTPQPEFFAGL